MSGTAESRYIVGIDLGTTNSSVAFIDTFDENPKVRQLSIPQMARPGELTESPLLPSFLFCPDLTKFPHGSFKLPWNDSDSENVVGKAARDCGTETPSRLIASAKSWLCHPGVNRRAKILPWNTESRPSPKSPLEATRFYLEHIREAWKHRFTSKYPLEKQDVTLTVPASFDETARELTLEAAQEAGFRNIAILEEPLAAFYAWLEHAGTGWKKHIAPGESVLVIDIGGGTSDFSVIGLDENSVLHRISAGDHLLLGGDNMDMALAKEMETRSGAHLAHENWLTLCQHAREAKEAMFSNPGIESKDITILSKGSSIIAGAKKFTLTRDTFERIINEGFFPEIAADTPSPKKASGIRQMGLPYETEPSITLHILEFLRYTHKITAHGIAGTLFRPSKILFNGGAMIPEVIRRRIMRTVGSWFPENPPSELAAADLSLAVSIGAAKAGAARRGLALKVRCGTSRSYYIEAADASAPEGRKFICILPRGMDENIIVDPQKRFRVEPNKKVSFPLWSAHARPDDKAGDELISSEGLLPVSSLVSVVRHTKDQCMDVGITSCLSESGIMELSIEAAGSKQKWPLKFDIRAVAGESETQEQAGTRKEFISLEKSVIGNACVFVSEAFEKHSQEELASVSKKLEEQLGLHRAEWSINLLRNLADSAMKTPFADTLPNQSKAARWLNFCGFAMRPGFGDIEDQRRIRELWKIWNASLPKISGAQLETEWWVFWRRLAPGLPAGHQRVIFTDLWNALGPKSKQKKPIQIKTEMWRCLASLELVEPERKISAGNMLMERVKKLEPFEFWAVGRFGARRLFRGTAAHVIPAKDARKWLEMLMTSHTKPSREALFVMSRLASLCGDRSLDLAPETLAELKKYFTVHNADKNYIEHLEKTYRETTDENAGILGESLPLGLNLIS